MERRPFLAPKAVIFGVDFTGPYILDVTFIEELGIPFLDTFEQVGIGENADFGT